MTLFKSSGKIVPSKMFQTTSVIVIVVLAAANVFLVFKVAYLSDANYSSFEQMDAVYTWVNGTDPAFLRNLGRFLKSNQGSLREQVWKRYNDKNELKYSLRSLERYAPWFRHVYIVTNGQIPQWLNLHYEKVSIVTHEEIFTNLSHLPTFSSNSIESHLHRIPGISKRFVYFNDDFFLAAPVFPDDFVSPSGDFLVYLAWEIPRCAENCHWIEVGDGKCHLDCYNASCQMDGGDCDAVKNKTVTTLAEHFALYYNYEGSPQTAKKTHYNIDESLQLIYKLDFEEFNGNGTSFSLPKFTNDSVDFRNGALSFMMKNSTSIAQLILHRIREQALKDKKRERPPNKAVEKKETMKLSSFGEALLHSHRLLNLRYGFKARHTAAHAPILIDKNVMDDLQGVFRKEFDRTSSSRIRSETDLQFAFTYSYFVLNEKYNLSVEELFDKFDIDSSGTWSSGETRTVLTHLYDDRAAVDRFLGTIKNCSGHPPVSERRPGRAEGGLPTVSKEFVKNCSPLTQLLGDRLGCTFKYRHKLMHADKSGCSSYLGLVSNLTKVLKKLDGVRKNPRKFVCINDDLEDSETVENKKINAALLDFYESLFPTPSKFELPFNSANSFFYTYQLQQRNSYIVNLTVVVFVFCACLYLMLFYRLYYSKSTLHRFNNKNV